ncbi:unnamed protein product, partial [Polarella glacialis]
VVRLCSLVEDLVGWKGAEGAEASPAVSPGTVEEAVEPPLAGSGSVENTTDPMSDAGSWLDPEERHEWGLEPEIAGKSIEAPLEPRVAPATQAMSDAGSWGDEDEDEEEGHGTGASSSAAPAAGGAAAQGQSEKTASIFHMPAVSSAASGAQALVGEGAAAAAASSASLAAGVGGVLEALRGPEILEALMARFVDPSLVLSSHERAAFARLLAIATTDGIVPVDGESGRTA